MARKTPEEQRAALVALWETEESAQTLTVRDVKEWSKLFLDGLETYNEWLGRAKAVEKEKRCREKTEREEKARDQQVARLEALAMAKQLTGKDILNADRVVSADERNPFIAEAAKLAISAMREAFDRHSRNIWGDYDRAAVAFRLHDEVFENSTLEVEWELRVLQYLRNRAEEDFEHQSKGSDAGLKVSYVEERWGHFERYLSALNPNNPRTARFAPVRALVAGSETFSSVRADYARWLEMAKLCQLSQADRRGPSLTTLAMALGHAVSKVDQDYILKLISAYQVGKERHEPLDLVALRERGYTNAFLDQFGTPTQQFHYCFGKPTDPLDPTTAGIGWLVGSGRLDLAVEKLKKLSTKDLQLLRKFTSGYIVAINGMTKPKLMRLEFTDAKAVEAALAKGGNNNPQGDGLQAVLYQHLRMLANLQAGWNWLAERARLPFPHSDLESSLELVGATQYGGVAELQSASLLFGWDRQEALRIGSCDGSPSGDWTATKVGADLSNGEREADGFRMTVIVFILNRVLPIEVTWDNCLDFADLAERLHQAHDPAQPGISQVERSRRLSAIEAMPAEVELQTAWEKEELKPSDVFRNREKLFNDARFDYWLRKARELQLEKHLAAMDEAYAQLDLSAGQVAKLWDLTSHLDIGERIALMGLYRFKISVQKGVWTLVLFSEKLGMLILDEEKDIEVALGKRELPNGGNVYDEAAGWMQKRLTPTEWSRVLGRMPTQNELDTVVGREPTTEEVAGIMNPMQPYLQHVVTYAANRAGSGLWGRANFRLVGDRMVKHNFDTINADNFMRMADIANLMMFVQGSLSKKSIIRSLLDGISDLLHIQIKF